MINRNIIVRASFFSMALFALGACKKGSPTSAPVLDMAGTWQLTNMVVNIHSNLTETVVLGGGIESVIPVSTYDLSYTSVKNAGTVKFESGVYSSTGMTYSIPDTAKAYKGTYQNGVLQHMDTIPMGGITVNGPFPNSGTYVQFANAQYGSADSFSTSGCVLKLAGAANGALLFEGGIYSDSGNTLTLTWTVTTGYGYLGQPTSQNVSVVMTLRRSPISSGLPN